MATVPTILPAGYILVYGWGMERTSADSGVIVPDQQNFVFGNIYQIWDGGETYVYGGDSVMWKKGDEYCRLAFDGSPYTMIEARLATKEIIVP